MENDGQRTVQAYGAGDFLRGVVRKVLPNAVETAEQSAFRNTWKGLRGVPGRAFEGKWESRIAPKALDAFDSNGAGQTSLSSFLQSTLDVHFPGNPAAKQIAKEVGTSLDAKLAQPLDGSKIFLAGPATPNPVGVGGATIRPTMPTNTTLGEYLKMKSQGLLADPSQGFDDQATFSKVQSLTKGAMADVNDAMTRVDALGGGAAGASAQGALRKNLKWILVGGAAVAGAAYMAYMAKPSQKADGNPAASVPEGFDDPYGQGKAGEAEGQGAVKDYSAPPQPYEAPPDVSGTPQTQSNYMPSDYDPNATRTSAAIEGLRRFAQQAPQAPAQPLSQALSPGEGAADPTLARAAQAVAGLGLPSVAQMQGEVASILGQDFGGLSPQAQAQRLAEPRVAQGVEAFAAHYGPLFEKVASATQGLDFGHGRAPVAEAKADAVRIAFSDEDAAEGFYRSAGFAGTAIKTVLRGVEMAGSALGGYEAIKGLTGAGKDATDAAEKHLGAGQENVDPAWAGGLKDADQLGKNMQGGDVASHALGVPQAFQGLADQLGRDGVPIQTVGKYVSAIAPMATAAYGNPHDFMEVAAAAMARTRGMTDGDQRVQEALGYLAPLVQYAKAHPGMDLMQAAARGLNGDASAANRIMLGNMNDVATHTQGGDPWEAMNAVFGLVTPSNLMRAQMNNVGLSRDKMLKGRDGFMLGVAGVKANFATLFYQHMGGFYGQLRTSLGPFIQNPIVQKVLSVVLSGTEAISKVEAIGRAMGGGRTAAADDGLVRLAQAAPDKYDPEDLNATADAASPSATKTYDGTSTPTPANNPASNDGSEAANNQRARGVAPNAAATPPNQAALMQLSKEIGTTNLPGARVANMTNAMALVEKQVGNLAQSWQGGLSANHVGIDAGPAMASGAIEAAASQIRAAIYQANLRVNEFLNTVERFYALQNPGSSDTTSTYIQTQNAVEAFKARAEEDRAKLKGYSETVEDFEKAIPAEMALMQIEQKTKAQEARIANAVQLNQASGKPMYSGLTGKTTVRRTDSQTGQVIRTLEDGPATQITALYDEALETLGGVQQQYQRAVSSARANGLTNLVKLFQYRVSQLNAKIEESQAKQNQYKYMFLQGKVPQGGFGNVAPGRAAASNPLRVVEADGEVFDLWESLLGSEYADAWRNAGEEPPRPPKKRFAR